MTLVLLSKCPGLLRKIWEGQIIKGFLGLGSKSTTKQARNIKSKYRGSIGLKSHGSSLQTNVSLGMDMSAYEA